MWALMRLLNNQCSFPRLYMGDFIEVRFDHVKRKGNSCRARDLQSFHEVISDCGLVDTGFVGYKHN